MYVILYCLFIMYRMFLHIFVTYLLISPLNHLAYCIIVLYYCIVLHCRLLWATVNASFLYPVFPALALQF